MNFVDEENFALLQITQDADQIELLLQHRARGLLDVHAEFGGDDSGERGFTQSRRAIEQHMIHRFAALLGGLDGDREILFDLRLAREIGQARRAQSGLELPLVFLQRCRNDALFPHEVSVY